MYTYTTKTSLWQLSIILTNMILHDSSTKHLYSLTEHSVGEGRIFLKVLMVTNSNEGNSTQTEVVLH